MQFFILIRVSFVLLLARSIAATNCPEPNCHKRTGAICAIRHNVINATSATTPTPTTSCRSFANLCELQRANCNQTRNVAWNQTDALHCHNFNVNETQACACPELRTCAGTATTATRICVRSKSIPRECRLMQEHACELVRARCAGEAWTNVDSLQCRGITLGKAACACPGLENCSTNTTNICVQNQRGCRIMQNECDLVRAQCAGEAWTNVDRIQCSKLNASNTAAAGVCACPKLQNCSTNTTNICVQSQQGGCRLLGNACELELARCQGENLTRIADDIQCRGFSAGEAANECACPMLETCAAASTLSPCVKGPNGCKLMANECELERALCMGETWSWSYEEHCINFKRSGAPQNCTCPKLANCTDTQGSGLCVHGRRGCQLMRNDCDLERARCRGEIWHPIDAIQCLNFKQTEMKSCACPKLKNCNSTGSSICVKAAQGGCQLMANECDLERARCNGETWTKVDSLQCHGFKAGDAKLCACPKLERCNSVGKSICVKGQSGCKLLKHECDLVRAKCAGEVWRRTDSAQCARFTPGEAKACACPCLKECSSTTNVCAIAANGQTCKHFRNECELRLRNCRGEKWTLTSTDKCEGIQLDASAKCACPQARRCSTQKRSVCARAGNLCKSFKSDCDFKKELCRNGVQWLRTNAAHCCQFRLGEHGRCTLTAAKAVCATINNRSCRQFRNECELGNANENAEEPWYAISPSRCKCFRPGQTKACAQPPQCKARTTYYYRKERQAQVCGRHGQQRRLFKTHCDLQMLNYRLCADFKPVHLRECRNLTNKRKRAVCQSC